MSGASHETGLPRVDSARDEFTSFARDAERRLRYALVAAYGAQLGREAAEEALVYAWHNWAKVKDLRNPVGYLYRVAYRQASRSTKKPPDLHAVDTSDTPWVEPGLELALQRLSPMQRTVAVLVEGLEWKQSEVAELLGIRPSSVQKHLERALAKLRAALGVSSNE